MGILNELLSLQKRLEASTAFKLQKHHQKLLDYLEKHGFITDREYAKLVDRAKATRALDFKWLLEQGLIERKAQGPKTYYVKIKP